MFEYWKDNCKCIGATNKQIGKLKKNIKTDIPQELIVSLKCCNSVLQQVELSSCCLFVGKCFMLLNIDNIIELYQDGLEYGYVSDKFYIPIADWNGDIFLFINALDNTIVYQDLENAIYNKIVFNNYKDFLTHIKDTILQKGSFDYEDLQKLIA